jgi:hypothetical protein
MECLMQFYLRSSLFTFAATAACVAVAGCGSDSSSLTTANSGTVVVQMTDAPFASDSVTSVAIFVTRVDARVATADSAAADNNVDDVASGGWQTIASPNQSFNLLAYQHGTVATLGQESLASGSYSGLRLIIDPTKSSVTLKNGQVLTASTSPSVTFPSAAHSGIKINLAQPVVVSEGGTTTLLVDFDVNNSFVLRGNSIDKNGLLFKPVINATVTNVANAVATISLANATDASLNLAQNGMLLTNGSNLAFGGSSSCTTVVAATPGLTVTQGTSSTALTGFSPSLTAGTSYTLVAYPTASGGTAFATLANTYTPTSGQTGLRVFNATSATTGIDVYLTAVGGLLGTPTATNVTAGSASTFVSVPAGLTQIQLTSTGSTSVVLDGGQQTLIAGKNATLVVAPAVAGSTATRVFLVPAC